MAVTSEFNSPNAPKERKAMSSEVRSVRPAGSPQTARAQLPQSRRGGYRRGAPPSPMNVSDIATHVTSKKDAAMTLGPKDDENPPIRGGRRQSPSSSGAPIAGWLAVTIAEYGEQLRRGQANERLGKKTLFLGGKGLAHASLCQFYPSIHVATFSFGVAFWSIWKRAIFFHLYKRALILMSISRSTFHT